MVPRRLGRTELFISPVGFGAFKIGRNQGVKYPQAYELPDDDAATRLLNGVLDLGINYIDTAPAYGTSEERVGRVLAGRRNEFVLSTKVGEMFAGGRSTYDFSRNAIRASVERSLERLHTAVIDILFIHAPHGDLEVLENGDAVPTLLELKRTGIARAIGLSAYTAAAARAAFAWADALMLEYSAENRTHEALIHEAAAAGVGVIVKKGLGAGHLPPAVSIPMVLGNPAVTSLLIGGLSIAHLREDVRLAEIAAVNSSGPAGRS